MKYYYKRKEGSGNHSISLGVQKHGLVSQDKCQKGWHYGNMINTERFNAWPGCGTFLSHSMMDSMKGICEDMFPFLRNTCISADSKFLLRPQKTKPERIVCWQPCRESWLWSDAQLAMSLCKISVWHHAYASILHWTASRKSMRKFRVCIIDPEISVLLVFYYSSRKLSHGDFFD